MTTLQILVIAFWVVVYLLLSIASLRDALNGEFTIKNGDINNVTATWVAITFLGSLVLITYAFIQ